VSEETRIDEIVHRHARAIVSMDIPQLMNDLEPNAMAKLQQQAGGGAAIQINDFEVLGSEPDGDDWLYDVKYIGAQSFTVRARWSQVGPEWKIVDADIVARESAPSQHGLEGLADEALREDRAGRTEPLDPDAL
jgi:hypothetical protein